MRLWRGGKHFLLNELRCKADVCCCAAEEALMIFL